MLAFSTSSTRLYPLPGYTLRGELVPGYALVYTVLMLSDAVLPYLRRRAQYAYTCIVAMLAPYSIHGERCSGTVGGSNQSEGGARVRIRPHGEGDRRQWDGSDSHDECGTEACLLDSGPQGRKPPRHTV